MPPGLELPKQMPSVADEIKSRAAEARKQAADSSLTPTTQPTPKHADMATASAPKAGSRRDRDYGWSSSAHDHPMVLPATYSPVLSRSIFIKGSQDIYDQQGEGSHGHGSAQTSHANSPTTQATAPEASLVFDGATYAGGKYVGLIENTNSHDIVPVSPGDKIARGVITSMTLDQLVYKSDGHTTRVVVGDNLQGQASSLAGAAAGGSGTGSALPASSAGGSSGSPSNANLAAAVVKMQLRRQLEEQKLNGK